MNNPSTKIGVIGDIHLLYDRWDTSFFNQSDYDLLLLVGDLGDLFRPGSAQNVAESLCHLTKPAIFIPGNHDVHNFFQLIAEVLRFRWLASISGYYHFEYHERLTAILNPIEVGGYSLHPYQGKYAQFDLIVARPFAMGGSNLSYHPIIRSLHGVKTMKQSTKLLCNFVDLAESDNIIFLGHNGPAGLGENPVDIWGCDFDPERGDFGDRDLQEAVQYAQGEGKRVLAVVAGHMHLQTYLGPKPVWKRRGEPGPERPFTIQKDGISYVNAARVPRILAVEGKKVHHHVCIEISGVDVDIREVFVEEETQE